MYCYIHLLCIYYHYMWHYAADGDMCISVSWYLYSGANRKYNYLIYNYISMYTTAYTQACYIDAMLHCMNCN